jgi:hypothetical protein
VTTRAITAPVAHVRVRLGADALALGALALLASLLLVVAWGTWGDLDSDTGYDLVAGARVADGELPYRDFAYYYGPLAPALSGLAALLGGSGVDPAIALGLLIAGAIVLATYGLARALAPPLGAFLAAALTAGVAFIPNNYSFVLPHTHAATVGTLLILALLLAAHRYAACARPGWLAAAGACAGLAALTKPEPALAALAAAATWLLLRGLAGAPWRRELRLLALPAVLVPAAVYGPLMLAVSPRELLLGNLWPVDELAAGGDALVRTRMPMTAGSVVEVAGKLALYAAGTGVLLLLARTLDRAARLRPALIAATLAGGTLVVAAALVKPDGVRDGLYYVYGGIPAGALAALGFLLHRHHRAGADRSPTAQLVIAATAALAIVAATTYGSFVVNGWRPQMAVYYIPLAAVLLARLHLVELARSRAAYALGAAWIAFLAAISIGLTLKDARAESVTVRGPGGALAETPAEAALHQQALHEIAARTRPGEPILAAPLLTGLYVLSGHESPLRELSLLPSALPSRADEEAAIRSLDGAGVRLVVTDDRTFGGYGHGAFGTTFQRRLAAWLQDEFKRVRTLSAPAESRTMDIWIRRTT